MAIMPDVRDPRTRKPLDGSQVLSPTGQSGTGQSALQARERRACSSLEQVLTRRETKDLLTLDSEQMRRTRRHAAVRVGSRLLADQCGAWVNPRTARLTPMKPVFATLTYANAGDWRPWHISRCVDEMKRQARAQGLQIGGYAWVAELQQRGAVHYHVIIWIPKAMLLAHPDKSGAWTHGRSNVRWNVDAKAAAEYLAAYCTKEKRADELARQAGHRYPKGCRRHGCGGLSEPARRIKRYALLPQYMRSQCTLEHDVRRAIGGGWISRTTAQRWESPWLLWELKSGNPTLVPRTPENLRALKMRNKLRQLPRDVRDWIAYATTRNKETAA